jgi:hypothetical protein
VWIDSEGLGNNAMSGKAAAARRLLLLVQTQTQTQRRDSYEGGGRNALGTRRTHGRFSGGPCSRL